MTKKQKITVYENLDGLFTVEWNEKRKKENLIKMEEKETKNIILDCLEQLIESDQNQS